MEKTKVDLLANAKTDTEREAIILKYTKLIKEAKYA